MEEARRPRQEERRTKLCVELHGNQVVYNVPALLRLRKEIGKIVHANLDPSHLMWMDADPLAAINALGPAIGHVHAKDTMINTPASSLTSRLENGGLTNIPARAWSYITLGYGKDEKWWRDFCYRLRMAGYDGWLSIEHEDVMLSREEGVRKSVALLKAARGRGERLQAAGDLTFLSPCLGGEDVARGEAEETATGEGQPLAPYSLQQGRSQRPPLTDRVALAPKRAARRGLLSP